MKIIIIGIVVAVTIVSPSMMFAQPEDEKIKNAREQMALIDDVELKYTERDMQCAEFHGGVLAMQAFVYGGTLGFEENPFPDSNAHGVFNTLTKSLLEAQQVYDEIC